MSSENLSKSTGSKPGIGLPTVIRALVFIDGSDPVAPRPESPRLERLAGAGKVSKEGLSLEVDRGLDHVPVSIPAREATSSAFSSAPLAPK